MKYNVKWQKNEIKTINKLTKIFYIIAIIFWIFYIGLVYNQYYANNDSALNTFFILGCIIFSIIEIIIISILLIITFKYYRKDNDKDDE